MKHPYRTLRPKALALLPLLLAAAPSAVAQTEGAARTAASATEEAAVRDALQHYLNGHATGLGSEHEKVFAQVARLFWIADGELRTRTSAEYIAGSPGEPAEDEAERRRCITMVDVAGDAAVARIELDYPRARIVDYMSLLKIDGEWRIVSKIFHVDPKPEAACGPPSGSGSARTTDAATSDPAPLDSLRRVFERAVEDNDYEAQTGLYAEDAIVQPPNRPARVGRAAIRGGSRRFLTATPDATIDYEPAAAGRGGDYAWEAGSAFETGTDSVGVAHADSGKYLWVWRRGSDGWRIVVHSFSLDAGSAPDAE